MRAKLKGKRVAVVTDGSAAGTGLGLVRDFAAESARLGI
jgi:hypothetical protein